MSLLNHWTLHLGKADQGKGDLYAYLFQLAFQSRLFPIKRTKQCLCDAGSLNFLHLIWECLQEVIQSHSIHYPGVSEDARMELAVRHMEDLSYFEQDTNTALT